MSFSKKGGRLSWVDYLSYVSEVSNVSNVSSSLVIEFLFLFVINLIM